MKPISVYACYYLDQNVRMSSSSGAVFSALSDYVFSKRGKVYGVAMSKDCYSAEYIAVTDIKGLVRLRGSKYLQAKVGNAYNQVKSDLHSGKTVLFSGTGCQINGLKCFLGKDYDNLICVDVICHGTPSPALWKKYAQYQEKRNNGKLQNVNFRCKDDSWIDFGMSSKRLFISKDKDSYMQMFLQDYCLRPSCYECTAKNVKMSDLTIADFWGINTIAPEMYDGRGTSLVFVRTDKGKMLWEKISKDMKMKEVSYEDGIKGNPTEYKSPARPQQRDIFFCDMHNMDFEELEKKYAPPVRRVLERQIKKSIKKIIKYIFKIFGGGQSV